MIREITPADAESDRLSDVVSEDLQSIPEDLQSVASEVAPRKRGVKEIHLTEPLRKRKNAPKPTKNVVVI